MKATEHAFNTPFWHRSNMYIDFSSVRVKYDLARTLPFSAHTASLPFVGSRLVAMGVSHPGRKWPKLHTGFLEKSLKSQPLAMHTSPSRSSLSVETVHIMEEVVGL
jgi:hypothetical protein